MNPTNSITGIASALALAGILAAAMPAMAQQTIVHYPRGSGCSHFSGERQLNCENRTHRSLNSGNNSSPNNTTTPAVNPNGATGSGTASTASGKTGTPGTGGSGSGTGTSGN